VLYRAEATDVSALLLVHSDGALSLLNSGAVMFGW